MNLLILAEGEAGSLIPAGDRRTRHVREVLRKGRGDEVAAGVLVDAPFAEAPDSLGVAAIEALDAEGMVLSYRPSGEAPRLRPLRLVLGFPRPIQGARLLRDLASLGVAEILLCGTELGEKSYLESDLWKKGEWRQAVLEGAEQAANPRIPKVTRAWTLARALDAIEAEDASGGPWSGEDAGRGRLVCLHPGEGHPLLGSLSLAGKVTLAIGSERGWSEAEFALLAARGFTAASLGDRILKTETAALCASAVALAGLGLV